MSHREWYRARIVVVTIMCVMLATYRSSTPGLAESRRPATVEAHVRSVAIRVHDAAAMEEFYSALFGITFRDVRTGSITSRFGHLGEMTLKFVPIRMSRDTTGYPVHQLGIAVEEIAALIPLVRMHGGRMESTPITTSDGVHAAVRDPDGNTIELYEAERARGAPTGLAGNRGGRM